LSFALQNKLQSGKIMKSVHPKSVLDYFARVNAEVLNFRRAMIKTFRGHYYIERSMIRLQEDGTVTSSLKEFAPTDEEAKAMKEDLIKCVFPKGIQARDIDDLKPLARGELFEFRDRATGGIIMVQERRMLKNGVKAYIPWVMFDTGEWLSMEPDGHLPFWKPEKREAAPAKVMIHEGAKAAAFVEALLAAGKDHPWAEDLANYQHWGMIGGALAPHRTDYQELRDEKPVDVVYACDNDSPGTSVLQNFARFWGKGLKGLTFGKAFPGSWDMADPMPKGLFARGGRYVGPSIPSLLVPATWATELIPPSDGKGRPAAAIKAEFSEEWLHSVTPEVFVHKDWPNRQLGTTEFNSAVSPFSHVDDTAKLLRREFSSKASVLKYIPSEPPGIYSGSALGTYINTFEPSTIKPEEGDASLWVDFIENLLPEEGDREEVLRWCATLVCRPDIKINYGVLMVSENQGVGKGTLGEKILAPLIGESNVSYPSEQELVESNFNYWLAHKRLAVVHEIYAGHSSKAYNSLKSTITDKNVTVQKKYMAPYNLDNWIHVFACSNSMRALKLSADDRRWLVPRTSEDKRPAAFWLKLNDWLTQEGGLQIVRWWLEEWLKDNEPVHWGADAPWTALKRQMVEEGYSPGQTLVMNKLEEIKEAVGKGELPTDVFVLDSSLVGMIREQLYDGRHSEFLERPATIRALAKTLGWHVGEARCQIKTWGPQAVGAKIIALDPGVASANPGSLGGAELDPAERRMPLDVMKDGAAM